LGSGSRRRRAAANENASNIYGDKDLTSAAGYTGSAGSVLAQIYNLIRFAYTFFYAIAVLLVAQAWLQFKQQKYDIMFASMGAALGCPNSAIIDFFTPLSKDRDIQLKKSVLTYGPALSWAFLYIGAKVTRYVHPGV
jgi:hypothetical protein